MKYIIFCWCVCIAQCTFCQDYFTPTKTEALRVSMEHPEFAEFVKRSGATNDINVLINEITKKSDTLITSPYTFTFIETRFFPFLCIGDLVLSKKSAFRIMYHYHRKRKIGKKMVMYTLGMYFEYQNNQWILTSHTFFRDKLPID